MLRLKARSVLAVVAAGVVCGIGAGAAFAAPPENAAQATCEAQGGVAFQSFPGQGYACVGDFSEARLRGARALCEHAYRGTFQPPTDFTHAYFCSTA